MVLAGGFPGIEVIEAASMEEALACTEPLLPLILLDIQLQGISGLDGIDLLQRRWPEARIVVLTSLDAPETAREARARGAHGFISKSDTPAEMVAVVTAVLEQDVPAEALPQPEAMPARLTPRQREVLELLCQGLSNKMIGRRLELSENTVRVHVQATLAALQVSSRSEAAFVARRLGLVR